MLPLPTARPRRRAGLLLHGVLAAVAVIGVALVLGGVESTAALVTLFLVTTTFVGQVDQVARHVPDLQAGMGAVVRLRQVGTDSTSITFYRVDDLNGTINGVHPEDTGYQALLHSRAYQTTTGGTSIAAPGYGDYGQTMLQHVNSGDIVAMQLTDNTHGNTFSAFAQANEVVNGQHVEHLMNYGLKHLGLGRHQGRRRS